MEITIPLSPTAAKMCSPSFPFSPKGVQLSSPRRPMNRTSKMMVTCRAATLEAPRVSSTNLYEVLSLDSKNVGFDEIKKAYRTMARQYHPDVVPASRKEESTKMFVQVQQAYEMLSDPISRQRYDLYGLNGMSSQESGTSFDRDVWEDQLSVLRSRSNDKKNRKKAPYK